MGNTDDKFTDEEIATAERAATDVEARYQAREIAQRAAARDSHRRFMDAAVHAPENKPTRLERKIEAFAQEINAAGETPNSLPIRQPLRLTGMFRIYFNRHQASPLVWCIALEGEDGPAFEIAVAEVVITAGAARTVYAPKAAPDDDDGRPSAWLEVDGVLRIDPNSSTARIG